MKKLSPDEQRVLGLALIGCFGALGTGASLANGMFGRMTAALAIALLVIAFCADMPMIRRTLVYQLVLVGVSGAITYLTRRWFGLNGLVDFGLICVMIATTYFLWRATSVKLREIAQGKISRSE